MSLDLAARLRTFLASAPQNVRSVQTLEISHSALTKTYHFWREPYEGATTTELGTVVAMQPLNFDIGLSGEQGHLDQQFPIAIDLVDIQNDFRNELDRIPVDTQERVRVVYREYLSDDLTEPQAVGVLQCETVSYRKGDATLSVVSPRLNVSGTGETYNPRAVPMLRAFV